MAITDINISEQLETDAPSIKYTGNEGPQNPQRQQQQMQQQQEMQIAQEIWEGLNPEQQGQFQSFEQFFQSGVWKQILQQMQADEGQGQGQGQGIGSLGPRPMEQQMPMPNRMGAEYGGRIGYRYGKNYKSNQGSNEMEFNRDALLKYLKERGASDEEIYEIIVKGRDISDLNLYKQEKFEEEKKQQRQQFERELEQDQWGHKFPISNEIDNFIRPMPEGWETARAQGGRMGARFGGDMEELSMRETIDTPEGIETLQETDTMKMAGGGDRGWNAQMLAQDLAQEEYGKDFYDLSDDLQHKIYTIALDMIDSGGE